MPARTYQRLALLFEQELRGFGATPEERVVPARRTPRVSVELDQQVVEFASETRSNGRTPEQMLVELKSLLSSVAPDVPGSERNALVSRVTGRAIDAFFGRS